MTLRVLFLEPQPCIRALKYARGLKWALNDEVSIVFGYLHHTLNDLYGHGDEVFDELVKLDPDNPGKGIKGMVNRFHPFVIHSHNAPDFLTISAIKAVNGEVPVIHDCHEALTLRETAYYVDDDEETIRSKYPREEKMANEQSAGRIYVTEGVRDYIQERYDVDPSRDMVFHSYVSKSIVPSQLRRKISEKDGETHIVYIGTVTSRIKESHYDLREIFRTIASHGIHVHMYVSIWGAKDRAYKRLTEENRFLHYHGHLDQHTLLEEITQYDYGWAGLNANDKNRRHLDVSLPNKVFEYIACGLPILSFPHKAIKTLITDYQVGLVLNSPHDITSQLKDSRMERIKENTLKSRYKFTGKEHIPRLLQHYKRMTYSETN